MLSQREYIEHRNWMQRAEAKAARICGVSESGTLIEWYLRNRRKSAGLFAMLSPKTYLWRPIPLRNPVVFYEGHLPAFSANTLLKKGFFAPPIDSRLDQLFARGIDPDDETSAQPRVQGTWPTRAEVRKYGHLVDAAIVEALNFVENNPEQSALVEMAYAILEHEAMHQETMLYMWHELPHRCKSLPVGGRTDGAAANSPPAPSRVHIPEGSADLGAVRSKIPFGWDNEFPTCRVRVPAFEIDVHNVTNGEFMAFVDAGAYRDRNLWTATAWSWLQEKTIQNPHFWSRRGAGWAWRGMFELIDLPLAWPVYVSQAEASAYARWQGRRLPTEAEYQRAAYGSPVGDERRYPWGDAPPNATHGNFDFAHWEPVPVGSYPAGASAWGVHDLVGNGWEWTSTPFTGIPGFTPMAIYPEYSADFFDTKHYVLKGASPATAKELIRPSFRNWFRANYPYVYATFRTARTDDESGR